MSHCYGGPMPDRAPTAPYHDCKAFSSVFQKTAGIMQSFLLSYQAIAAQSGDHPLVPVHIQVGELIAQLYAAHGAGAQVVSIFALVLCGYQCASHQRRNSDCHRVLQRQQTFFKSFCSFFILSQVGRTTRFLFHFQAFKELMQTGGGVTNTKVLLDVYFGFV